MSGPRGAYLCASAPLVGSRVAPHPWGAYADVGPAGSLHRSPSASTPIRRSRPWESRRYGGAPPRVHLLQANLLLGLLHRPRLQNESCLRAGLVPQSFHHGRRYPHRDNLGPPRRPVEWLQRSAFGLPAVVQGAQPPRGVEAVASGKRASAAHRQIFPRLVPAQPPETSAPPARDPAMLGGAKWRNWRAGQCRRPAFIPKACASVACAPTGAPPMVV